MKKFIPILSAAFFLTACTSDPKKETTQTLQSAQQNNALSIDTAGLAQFQQWKTQNELQAAVAPQTQEQPTAAAPVKTVTIIREVRVPQPVAKPRPVRQPVAEQPKPPVEQTPEVVPSEGGANETASNTGGVSDAGTSPAEQAGTTKEGGWSSAKKGTVIGAGSGAVIGAVLNKKNRAVGAVIGGVLGGAVGYGIGKKKDASKQQ